MENINKKIGLFIATGFCSGYFPIAPGTVGTAVAAPIVFLLSLLNNIYIYVGVFFFLFFLGVWSSFLAEAHFRKKDPGHVNIDEIAGFLVTMFMIPVSVQSLIIGFFVFRMTDIIKIPPTRKLEEINGGWGIMLDDICAGIYAWIFIKILIILIPGII